MMPLKTCTEKLSRIGQFLYTVSIIIISSGTTTVAIAAGAAITNIINVIIIMIDYKFRQEPVIQ